MKTGNKQQTSSAADKSESVKPAERLSANLAVRQTQLTPTLSWAEELRQAIRADGRSIYAITLAAFGSSTRQRQVSRFLDEDGGITLDNAERLARAVGWAPDR